MTALPEHPALVGLPSDLDALRRVMQRLLLHRDWAPRYGVTGDSIRIDEQNGGRARRAGPRDRGRALALTRRRVCRRRGRRERIPTPHAPSGGRLTPVTARPPRAGYRSVTPRIFVADVARQVAFLRDVFDAVAHDDGGPVDVDIGDSRIIVSSAAEREPHAAFLYVYVDDADTAYERAVAAGAVSLEAPLDTPYGDRRAMVRDPCGNVLQIAHPLDGG
jgi:PhnB protein